MKPFPQKRCEIHRILNSEFDQFVNIGEFEEHENHVSLHKIPQKHYIHINIYTYIYIYRICTKTLYIKTSLPPSSGGAPQPCECPDRNRQDLPLQRIAVPPLPSTNKNVHISRKTEGSRVAWSGNLTRSMGRLYIHLHENHKNQPKVGKYSTPMDPMGMWNT